jgi:RNA polymerase-binding transcription factor DksA
MSKNANNAKKNDDTDTDDDSQTQQQEKQQPSEHIYRIRIPLRSSNSSLESIEDTDYEWVEDDDDWGYWI